jgi:hypothetical protein
MSCDTFLGPVTHSQQQDTILCSTVNFQSRKLKGRFVYKDFSYPAIGFTQFLCKEVMDLGIRQVLFGWVILQLLHVYVPSTGVQLAETSAVKHMVYMNIYVLILNMT